MPSIKDFIDAMQSSWPVALTIFIGAAAVLAGDYYHLPQLAGLPGWLVGSAFIAAAFSGAIVIVSSLRGLWRLATLPARRARSAKWRQKHIEGMSDLPADEVHILLWALVNGRQVIAVEYFDERVKALSAKGYLSLIPGSHHTNKVPYMIPDHIWEAMRKEEGELPWDTRQAMAQNDPFGRRW